MRCDKEVLSRLVLMIAGALFLSASASAGVTIAGTRVIFPAAEREKSIRTNNKGSSPVLVQVWVDDGSKNNDINSMLVPFTVTPPVYRIDPGKGQSVRLIYNGMELPGDRESVYWFNLLEIPTVNDEDKNKDRLELAFRTRIKIFYRPPALTGNSTDYISALRWQMEASKKAVKIENPTPYYFSFESVTAKDGKRTYPLVPQMLAPYTSLSLATEGSQGLPASIRSIEFNVLNDYGSTVTETVNDQQNPSRGLKQSAGDKP